MPQDVTDLTKPYQLQNNLSSVAFKVYEPTVPSSSPYTFAVSDVEHYLRNSGHLVYADPNRRVLWCFSLVGSDGSVIGQSTEVDDLGQKLEICGHTLSLLDEGSLEPISLLKSRLYTPNTLNTPSSSSPSGPGLDAMARPVTTPGTVMPLSTFPTDADVKQNSGSTDAKTFGSLPPKDIHEYFITSVLATLSQRFCSKTSAIPLDMKTFLLPCDPSSLESHTLCGSNIASLRVHLTTTGSLLIGVSISHALGIHANVAGLSPLLPPTGSTILAAPFGVFGTFQGLGDADQYSVDGSAVQSPESQILRLRPEISSNAEPSHSVFNATSNILETRGVSITNLSSSTWLSIQSLRQKPSETRTDGKRTPVINPHSHIMWPAVLCYRKRTRSPVIPVDAIGLGTPGSKNDFDAMKSAKSWFLGSEEREDLLTKKKREREAALTKGVGEADPRLLRTGLSPHAAARRPSHTGAPGGAMYPTPPDGIQNQTGVTPSVTDGATSSPVNPMAAVSMGERDTAFNQESWDLNNDVLIENDITDADFNFFDEQPSSMDSAAPIVPDVNTGLTTNEPSAQPPMQVSQQSQLSTTVKSERSPAPPVFAKPELKHARSNMGRGKASSQSAHGVKRAVSPFDPVSVYKRLKASIGTGLAVRNAPDNRSVRRGSKFDKLHFDRSFAVVNKKYEQNGRYNFQQDGNPGAISQEPGSLPTTEYLRRHGKTRSTFLKDVPTNLGAQVAGMAGTVGGGFVHLDHARADESTSDADDISLVSDQDDNSDFSDEPSSPSKFSVRRRVFADDNESLAPSMRDYENMDEQFNGASLELSKLSITDCLSISLSAYFVDPESVPMRMPMSDEEFVMVAQILTEQAVSGSVALAPDSAHDSLSISSPRRDIIYNTRRSLQTLQSILPPSLQSASQCHLRQLIDVQDVPLLAPPSRMQPRPPGGPEPRATLVQINPPHLELRRYENRLSVLPSAMNFWESLGLGPSQGPKDVHAVCVFPNLDGLIDSAGVYLDRLRSVYESLRLGSFERMTPSAAIPAGLLPFEVDKTASIPTSMQGSRYSKQSLVEDLAKIAVTIFNATVVSKNFVVFFIYTPDNPATIVEACYAFQRLFELYKRAFTERKRPIHNELVLQLVPMNHIVTSTSVVVLPSHDCIRTCFEVYDRCTMFGGPMPSPAIVLEQQLNPQGINFQLRNQPSANVLQENSIMHIAYAQSVDERWITAAWTDNRGSKQMTASYCLGRKGKPLSRSFADVAFEIWTTTHDLTSIWKVHWRIVITKVGSMDLQEISDWTTLAQTEIKSTVTLALFTVNTSPSLQLIPSIPKVSMTAQSSFYSTPVSTPQPATMSPEQVGNPPTPKGGPTSGGASTPGGDSSNTGQELDGDASLVDITDTIWGAIASHRLNTSHVLTDPTPALISGYLIKRGGARTDDPPAVMEVNLVHCEGNPRMHDMLLREMLSVFRGLATVARARSVTEKEGDVRPWHVAAAEKGMRALYQLM